MQPQLSHTLLSGPLLHPKAAFSRPPKTQISRKLLQAYFNTTPRDLPDTPSSQFPRSLSYSKLLRETPETFRLQRRSRKSSCLNLPKDLKLPGTLSGIKGVKSILTGKSGPRPSACTARCEKACSTSMSDEGWDPDTIDISPEGYLASGQVVPLPRIREIAGNGSVWS